MREVYFHEDDYCQIEVMPDANWGFCARQASEINAFSEAHRAEVGWTDMYIRSENPHRLSELAIPSKEFTAAVSRVLPAFDRILTGYGSYTEICEHTLGFGKDEGVVVFGETTLTETVSAIWLTLDTATRDDKMDALNALQALSVWPLMLADWGWTTMIRLSDTETLNRYLDKRVEVFSRPLD